jgi:hypothetical protein
VRVVRDQLEIENESRAGAAGSARAAFEMPRQQGVVERAAAGVDDQRTPPNGTASLEFVQRHMDAGVVQPRERALDAMVANQARAGVVRHRRLLQQRRVRARGVLEDRALQQLEKSARATAQRRFQNSAAVRDGGRRLPEKARQACDHPRAHQAFVED